MKLGLRWRAPMFGEGLPTTPKRTLTNLYKHRIPWLDLAHRKLDATVFAAYNWDPAMSDDGLLATPLALNLARGGK